MNDTADSGVNGSEDVEKATGRAWVGLAVLALPTLLLSLDVSVLYLALPSLSADLGADSTQQLWILDIYSFLLAGFLVTMGTLGDRIGRRRLLLIGAAAFGAASVLAASSSSPEQLIVSRAVLGLAGATLMPSTMALIRNMFPDPVQMGRAIGIWFSCFMGGVLLGPVIGGFLLEHFWWGSAFLLGVPVMVLLLITGPILLPEYRNPSAGRIDALSVVLSLGTILPAVWGLKELARSGWAVPPMMALVVGAGLGVVFVRRQRRLADPLLDLTLFRRPKFGAALGVMLAGGVVMAGISLQTALFLQVVEGLSPLRAGLWLIPQSIAMVAGLSASPAIAQRTGTAKAVAAGLILAAVGLLVVTGADGTGGVGFVVAGLAITSFGMGLPMALTAGLMLAAAPPERAGSAASLSETSGEGGIALGVALLGSLGTFVYRRSFEAGPPADVPAEIVAQARQSVTAAMLVAEELPGQSGTALATAAKAAFASSLDSVAGVGAIAFAGCAILAAVTLRDRAGQGLPATRGQDSADAGRPISGGHGGQSVDRSEGMDA
ncbi:DHA2 family multidrug resistance protein-like MFS transporter [Kribbella amoyensis]|uniref:DHA2 family multidrug resistance protein-like MFS transporter n=1 Tax=Kribbella amoyensis TaxID=996641 RepID=A0A561BS12_9ACTN|nr:MFS transporter [Kribbella amoyensis]TWD81688.1 DHA2 family multidrug resistance protein-like MFS transporter [Kribbella amoyensis]